MEELRKRQQEENKTFELGKLAYARGQYETACKLFEDAVGRVGKHTQAGGEAQLWLALAYQVRV